MMCTKYTAFLSLVVYMTAAMQGSSLVNKMAVSLDESANLVAMGANDSAQKGGGDTSTTEEVGKADPLKAIVVDRSANIGVEAVASVNKGSASSHPTLVTTSHPTRHPHDYTILINTWQRHDCVQKAIVHWLSCRPRQIRVTWLEGDDALPAQMRELEKGGKLVIDRHENKLSNRFRPRDLVTTAVFTVDDDIVYGCDSMANAFRQWQQNPQKAVGFAPRYIRFSVNRKGVAQGAAYTWKGAYELGKANTLWFTKGAFLRKDLLDEYFSPAYKTFRDEVDEHITGEDILFSFIFAHTRQTSVVPMVIHSHCLHNTQNCGQVQSFDCGKSLNARTSAKRGPFLNKMYFAFGSFEAFTTHTFIDAGSGLPGNTTSKKDLVEI